jgi:PAS domain-containing protein
MRTRFRSAVRRTSTGAGWRAQLDRARLELAMHAAQLVVWTWDMRTGEIDMGESSRRIAHLPPEVTHTAQVWALMHPDDVPPTAERAERLRNGEPDVDVAFRLPDDKGGWRWIVGRVMRFGEGDLPFIVGVAVDDTDRRAQAEALRRSEHAARSSR